MSKVFPIGAFPLANYRCKVGEGPLFDAARGCVYWTDIETGRLFSLDVATGAHRCIYTGVTVGGFTLQVDGRLMLFRRRDFVEFDPSTGQLGRSYPFTDEGCFRFNDVCALPSGAVLAGGMSGEAPTGGLFYVGVSGEVRLVFRGTRIPNGMGFSPDHRTLYYSDSTENSIFAYDFDPATDAMSNRRVFHKALAGEGTCDGLTTDTEGRIYSARWDGAAIYRYLPDGSADGVYRLPVPKVTSMAFGGGGAGLRSLYVSTAGGDGTGTGDAGAGTADGTLYRLDLPDAVGRLEFVSRVGGV